MLDNKVKFNVVLLIVTAIIGVLVYYLSKMTFDLFAEDSLVLAVGFAFTILYVVTVLIVVITVFLMRANYREVLFGNYRNFFLFFLGSVVLTFGLSCLLQYIYSRHPDEDIPEMTSIVFLIDESGSMRESDPARKRYEVITRVADDLDDTMPYMAYCFSDDTEMVRGMGTKSEEPVKDRYDTGGQTEMKEALEKILSDKKNGAWEGGEAPRVVILTDGFPTDFYRMKDIDDLLEDYIEEKISISVVGLYESDYSLMTQIAQSTKGTYVTVDNVGGLYSAMKKASMESMGVSRHLFGYRIRSGHNLLLAIMRIVFLTLLGAALGIMAAFACFFFYTVPFSIMSMTIKSLIGAIFAELMIQNELLDEPVMWQILWGVFATVFAFRPVYKVVEDDGVIYDSKTIDNTKKKHDGGTVG